ncbi:MAG: tyrosine--tRNA ligase [Erysipelotrichales bacterium]|nr:tyrosine--tRNA ligase [Erysipelotrichales bacterium]
MKLFEDLQYRGLVHSFSDPELIDKLNNEKLTFYLGTDPTGESLHVGHLVVFLLAKRLEMKGHKPLLLIGGATGFIGDPRPGNEREFLSKETLEHNTISLFNQVQKLFKCQMVNNYDWTKDLSFIDFLRKYGKHFSINYLLAKESVASRLQTGISFTEFSYNLMQAMDFHHLYLTENCTLQIGGQDQWGNLLSGLDLIRKLEKKAECYCLTAPLLTKADGGKFGKSEGGESIWLSEDKTSVYEFYQYWINTADNDCESRLKTFTFLDKAQIDELAQAIKTAPEKREAQKILAFEVTKVVHGEDKTKEAIMLSEKLFTGDISNLTKQQIESAFKGIEASAQTEISLIDALITLKLAVSKREAREFIQNGSISVNGIKINDSELILNASNALHKKYNIIRRGKKKYAYIIH